MKRKAGKQVVGAKPLPPPKGSGGQAAAGKGKAHRNKVRGREKIPKGGRRGVLLWETSRLSLLIECASSLVVPVCCTYRRALNWLVPRLL